MLDKNLKKLYYIAEFCIPSQSAYSIHVLKMCDATTNLGYKTNLIIPNSNTKFNIIKNNYNLKNKFNIISFFKNNHINFLRRIIFSIYAARTIKKNSTNIITPATTRNTWYKDGTLITDTTQKFKPSSAGSYSVKTTQNGCISAMSSPYYYLVTDIIQFKNGEFIKLTPNPFINFVNIDFIVKGHQRLNIEVFSAATGAKVAIRIGITAGSRLTFNALRPGVYFIRVATSDLKVMHQFKMVKF